MSAVLDIPPMVEIEPDGTLAFNFHYGQRLAWESDKRIVAVIAGTQSGKTTFGPLWLMREIQLCGPGTYLIAAPTDPLLQVKLIPEFKRLFVDMLGLGVFVESPRAKFVVSKQGQVKLWGQESEEPTVVYFGYAAKPDSLESMTVKAAWLDEAGQPEFKVGSWEAILRRLSLSQGRILITTTPYTVGHWLKRRVFNKAADPRESIDVVQFKSMWNPVFPKAEWLRAKRDLPKWKFDMMYCGSFSKPAGQIYDVFSEAHTVPRMPIPRRWTRYLGLDFGGINTSGVFIAERPDDGAWFVYKTYRAGNRTAAQHVEAMMRTEPYAPLTYGGAKSEQQWRDEFAAGGLPVRQPLVTDVEIGIDRVYSALSNHRLYIFDDLDVLLDQFDNYSRAVDADGNVLDAIKDKNEYHELDALRYIVGSLEGGAMESGYSRTEPLPEPDDRLDMLYNNWYAR